MSLPLAEPSIKQSSPRFAFDGDCPYINRALVMFHPLYCLHFPHGLLDKASELFRFLSRREATFLNGIIAFGFSAVLFKV